MDFETYARSKLADYAALAENVAAILRAAIAAYPHPFRLQQVQQRAKNPESLCKKLEDRGKLATASLEDDIKDLAGCRLIFYTNSDVSRFLQSGIIQDNFDVDWDRTKIHHPIPGQTEPGNLFISSNYVLTLKANRTALPEYALFGGLRCEVQVQTTLNHAWSEMEHDIIYKKPVLQGFGGRLFEAIEQRLQNVMKAHLLPAGYEFQKALDDYERLLSGKEILDRGALKALAEYDNNNERYELLERFRDYVLPNYDDLESVYPEIREQLVAAVKVARLTKPRPIETPFGNIDGITAERIVEIVADILTFLRYIDVEATFDAICALFPDSQNAAERKHLLGLAERLAQHNLDVWKQAGAYVQTVLVQKIHAMDRSAIDPLRPVLLEVLGEALKPEVHGVTSHYKGVTLSQGSAIPSNALARMRSRAIELLAELYRTASSEAEKRRTELALFEATRTPNSSGYANDLLVTILNNSAAIMDFFASVAPTESYEMLQTIEHKALFLHERDQGIEALAIDESVQQARDALDASILRFRDASNSNRAFTIYKVLVGFESVFPPAWDDPEFDYEAEEAYRKEHRAAFVAEIDEANAEEWFAIIQRCAQTESNDLATFPSFGEFLQQLGQAKPQVVLGFLDKIEGRLTDFLGTILSGLAQSDRRADLDAKIRERLAEEKHLVAIAHYVQLAPQFEPSLLQEVLALGTKLKDDVVLRTVMSAFARRYADAPEGLIDAIFLPAIEYFTERRDARWINLVWFLPEDRSPFRALTAGQADVVLRSLLHLPRVESHAERAPALIAKDHPEKVFDFFGQRFADAASHQDEERYEEVPFRFFVLNKCFANIASHAVARMRSWFASGDPLFQFRGGRLLASSFPGFSAGLGVTLLPYVENGNREDIEFVIRVMSSYHGEPFLNETCKAVVRALPAGDPLLGDVEVILQSTGVVAGEFGFVEAYARKKQETAGWLTDADDHVRAFAESYVRLLDRRIAAEQRRSEESIEMRKRMYDDPEDDAA